MQAAPLPLEMFLEIALQSDLPAQLALTRLSTDLDIIVRPLIYSNIIVHGKERHLVHSLACNSRLPPMVKSLVLETVNRCSPPDTYGWRVVLMGMINLKHLVIAEGLPLSRNLIPQLPFRLMYFGARCALGGAWAEFIHSQKDLEELALDDKMITTLPALPRLRTLKARPSDAARFAESYRLHDVWLWDGSPYPGSAILNESNLSRFARSPAHLQTIRLGAGQLVLLMKEAPTLLSRLQHIAFDEDDEWLFFGHGGRLVPERILAAGAVLDGRFPDLKSIMLVSETDSYNVSDLLIANKGLVFSRALSSLCTAPLLHMFHFCAYDGCITLKNWRREDEKFHYKAWEEHGAWDLDE
ncbi:hypothetical protein DFH07DRAFT_966908 [Mycena maculata]|uniref:Uncharacterized protein n=1 Tax=Mycena maculata TaxID=230809 RepID=A0AAD7MWK9_9AGAR|nr:hypothetical protein DFH07DRAFT_966908 [Mycena maculata]